MCVRARARVCVCVCMRERERERERDEHFYEVNFIFTKVVLAHSKYDVDNLQQENKSITRLFITREGERESFHNEY